MEFTTLNNGQTMPLLGFGTFQMNDAACRDAVCAAIQTGYRLIDTAEAYGNEAAVGQGIQASGIARGDLFLATKVNFRSYDHARDTVLASLDKLQTDYLDLVLLHWPFGNYYAAWRELEQLYAEGVVRAIGISNFYPDRMIDLMQFHQVTPAVNQIETNLHCQRQAERVWLDKYQVQPMAYAPLGQGQRGEMFAEPQVLALAERYGKTPGQILLRFLTQQGIVAIPKSVHPERMAENLAIFDFTLTEAELETLRGLDKGVPMIGKAEVPEFVEFAMTW